jgi:hypothetical protein
LDELLGFVSGGTEAMPAGEVWQLDVEFESIYDVREFFMNPLQFTVPQFGHFRCLVSLIPQIDDVGNFAIGQGLVLLDAGRDKGMHDQRRTNFIMID